MPSRVKFNAWCVREKFALCGLSQSEFMKQARVQKTGDVKHPLAQAQRSNKTSDPKYCIPRQNTQEATAQQED
ncbi:hypothetical protein WN944_020164 [Citrus x changshan-huyou]|uniref:Uncharacterized protein n=1 Tax=Citrus x changshan-huyou TaxID=2935761 RepID=A0AAP0M2Z2_9ROSI